MPFLLEDSFKITGIDLDGKCFQHVSRMTGTSQRQSVKLVCDYNSDLFKPIAGNILDMVLTLTLNDDDSIDPISQYNPRLHSKLMDQYEYVMHGKIFKVKQPDNEDAPTEVYISYGGLLMSLIGPSTALHTLELDANVYLLIRHKQ